jgi:hypothetical protein
MFSGFTSRWSIRGMHDFERAANVFDDVMLRRLP